MQSRDLKELEISVSELDFQLTVALDQAADSQAIEDLIALHQAALNELENARLLQESRNNTSYIHSMLHHPGLKVVHARAEPLEKFSDAEILEIKTHYDQIPAPLKALIDAALNDDRIQFDYVKNPVFLRCEGHVYDMSLVSLMLKDKDEANYPNDPSKKFNGSDIIPCNTLIRAMKILLNIIKGQQLIAPAVEKNTYLSEMSERKRITPEEIRLIEGFYSSTNLQENHRALFDVICRDRLTKMVMDDPVYLPDGYAYDRSTALFLLEAAHPAAYALCPFSDDVTYKKEDITPSFMVMRVLDQLNINIKASQSAAVSLLNEDALTFKLTR